MLRRRPAAVYELLAEDEFRERARAADGPARQPDGGGLSGHGYEPVGAAAAPTVGLPAATARRTLLVALTAAALVGFAVWELLGIAGDSVASRPGAAFQQLHSDIGQPPALGRRGSHQLRRAERARAATRWPHAFRAAAGDTRARAGMPAAPVPAISSPAAQPGRPPMPAAPLLPDSTPLTPLAEQEFGFER